MPTLELSDEQVVQLVKQLAPARQQALLRSLLGDHWRSWAELSAAGGTGARAAAARRGRDWDAMTEPEREAFIDDLVHEDRP